MHVHRDFKKALLRRIWLRPSPQAGPAWALRMALATCWLTFGWFLCPLAYAIEYCSDADYAEEIQIPSSDGSLPSGWYLANKVPAEYAGQATDGVNTLVIPEMVIYDEHEDACGFWDFWGWLCNGPWANFHAEVTAINADGGGTDQWMDLVLPGPTLSDDGNCEFYDVHKLGSQLMLYRSLVLWDRDWLVHGKPAVTLQVRYFESDEGWGDDTIREFEIDLTSPWVNDDYVNLADAYMIVADDVDGDGWWDYAEFQNDLSYSSHPYSDDDGDGQAEAPFIMVGNLIALSAGDCDDNDPASYIGAVDTWYDGVDNDCAGNDDFDADVDGFSSIDFGGDDCNDADAAFYPGAADAWYDGVDNDCAGNNDFDADADGFDFGGDDCIDYDATIHPGAEELWYDGIDQNCDGGNDYDQDGDGYLTNDFGGADCDDRDHAISHSAVDIPYDAIDQDCDGADLTDIDNDGYDGTSGGGSDCDDEDADVHPGAAEINGDGIDEDCFPSNEDEDLDGHTIDDCDDHDASIFRGATEVPYDGVDQDCDGGDLTDADADGFDGGAGSPDCNDRNPAIHPGQAEIAYDNIDQDCDGGDMRDVDGDGHASMQAGGDDCDDYNLAIFDCPDADPARSKNTSDVATARSCGCASEHSAPSAILALAALALRRRRHWGIIL